MSRPTRHWQFRARLAVEPLPLTVRRPDTSPQGLRRGYSIVHDTTARADGRILVPVAKKWLVGAGSWAVVAVLAFLFLPAILAAFLVILVGTVVVVGVLSADWDRQSTFQERELVRARKRAEKRERTKDARARDRAKWEAHQARQAAKAVETKAAEARADEAQRAADR